jgi:hypothetical protein
MVYIEDQCWKWWSASNRLELYPWKAEIPLWSPKPGEPFTLLKSLSSALTGKHGKRVLIRRPNRKANFDCRCPTWFFGIELCFELQCTSRYLTFWSDPLFVLFEGRILPVKHTPNIIPYPALFEDFLFFFLSLVSAVSHGTLAHRRRQVFYFIFLFFVYFY